MTSPAAKPAPAPYLQWRRLLRRLMIAGAALLLIFAVVFFLIPVWISNDQGRLYVLDRLNARLHGPRVAIDQWSLSWFGATDIKNLRVLEPDGTPMLTCPHVSSGLTLWDLLWSNYDFRNTTADSLEMRIQKNSDGTTSLDSFAAGAGDVLRSARGALQINGGKLLLVSTKTGESMQYQDFKAAIAIASPEAPFRVQISGVAGGTAPMTLSATFPPTQDLAPASMKNPHMWAMVDDLSFSAQQVPTAMACDFLAMDAAWVDSFGQTLSTVSLTGHTTPAHNEIRMVLHIAGIAKKGEPTALDAAVQLIPPGEDGRGATINVRSGDPDASTSAALHFSAPLARLLGRINPILGEATAENDGLVQATATFSFPLDQPGDTTAVIRATFPPLAFTPRDGPSLVRQIEVVTGELPRRSETRPISGSAGVLRAALADGQFSYDNFQVVLGKAHISFSGTVSLGGAVDLLATIPDPAAGLAAGDSRVGITGSFEAPLLRRAE